MRSTLFTLLLLLDVIAVLALFPQCPPKNLPIGKFNRSVPTDSFLSRLESLFPESSQPDASVRLNEEVVYTVISPDELTVTFLHDGGIYPSTVGYYVYNSTTKKTEQERVLFPDVNCARVGDSLNIGSFPNGTRIGFYITAPQNSTSYTFWSHQYENGANPDDICHVSLTYIDQVFVIGFEDIFEGGDKDFNDVMLSVRIADVVEPTCCNNDSPKALRCYEGASLIILVASVFLGFSANGLQVVIERLHLPLIPPRRWAQFALLITAAVLFIIALVICIIYRIRASGDLNLAYDGDHCKQVIASVWLVGAGIITLMTATILA